MFKKVLFSLVFASSLKAGFIIYGAGAFTCSKYLELIKTDEKYQITFNQYLEGFATGKGFAEGKNIDYFKGYKNRVINKHIEIYCNNHPLKIYYDAIQDLFNTLDKE